MKEAAETRKLWMMASDVLPPDLGERLHQLAEHLHQWKPPAGAPSPISGEVSGSWPEDTASDLGHLYRAQACMDLLAHFLARITTPQLVDGLMRDFASQMRQTIERDHEANGKPKSAQETWAGVIIPLQRPSKVQ